MRRCVWLLSTAVCLGSSVAQADDLDTLHARLIDSYIADSAPSDAADIAAAHAEINTWAQTIYASQLQADGSIAKLDYATQAGLATHYSRVRSLATAYSIRGGPLYHDAGVLAGITRALGYGGKSFCGNASCVSKESNWWYWQIGIPRQLGPTLLMLQGYLDPKVFASELSRARFHVGPYENMGKVLTGDNLLEEAFNHLRFALIDRAPKELEAVRNVLNGLGVISAGYLYESDGIKPDYSFQQHRGIPYSGGYGASFASSVGTYLQLTEGTAYRMSEAATQTMLNYGAEGVRWAVYGNYWDVVTVGRYYSRNPPPTAVSARDALIKMSFVSGPRQAEIRASAKALLAAAGPPEIDLLPLVERLQAFPEAAASPSGHRHFYSSDHTVHRRDDYFASLRMFSTRTQAGEVVNDEGKRCSREADGSLYLVREGDEFFGKGLWPAVDWARLSGITVEQSATAANDDCGPGLQAFVGGTGDARNGVSAMDLQPRGSTLRALKSWFFFDDSIVFLGSGIRATSALPVETIVHQWPLSTPNAALLADGTSLAAGPYTSTLKKAKWLSADGWGYFFPSGADVQVEIKDQTGDWSQIGTGKGAVSARFLTLSLQHGAKPSEARYAYAIALNGQDMKAWAAGTPFTVLQNDTNVSAVRSGNSTGVVFWKPGRLALSSDGALTSSSSGVVWLTDDGNEIELTTADPAARSAAFTLELSGKFEAGEGTDTESAVELGASSAHIAIAGSRGESHGARLLRTLRIEMPGEGGAPGEPNGTAGATPAPGQGGGSNGGEPALGGDSGSPSTARPAGEDRDCSCRAAGRSPSSSAATLLALACAALYARRRATARA